MIFFDFLRLPQKLCGLAADFFFPDCCVLCGCLILPGMRAGPYPLCASCARGLRFPEAPRCGLCSRPLISEKGLCMSCRRLAPQEPTPDGNSAAFPFKENISVFVYQDPGVAELVVSYKGRKKRSLAAFFAEKLLAEYRTRWDGIPLVPVPCRHDSLKKRGFDPIGLMCREMKKRGGPEILRLLARRGKTLEQKKLNRDGRQKNLRGALAARRRLPAALPRAVVLVDDVFTTGATAAACAQTLKDMGIDEVYVLTIALD